MKLLIAVLALGSLTAQTDAERQREELRRYHERLQSQHGPIQIPPVREKPKPHKRHVRHEPTRRA